MNESKKINILRKRNLSLLKQIEYLKQELKDAKNQKSNNETLVSELDDLKTKWESTLNDLNNKKEKYDVLINDLRLIKNIWHKSGAKVPLGVRIRSYFK